MEVTLLFDQFVDKDIEELPPEISSIENPIFSCDPTLTLRTIQEFLGVTPLLGDAANAPDLIDLFAVLRVAGGPGPANAGFQLTVTGAVPGMHQLIQRSTDLKNWTTLADWVADAANYHFLDHWRPTPVGHYYRVVQTP